MVRYHYCPPKNLYTGCYYKLYDNPYYKVYLNNYTGSQTSDRYFASKMNRYYDRHEKLLSDKIEKNEHEEYRQYRDKIKKTWLIIPNNGKPYKFNTITRESRWL